jgi:hypothetical protein
VMSGSDTTGYSSANASRIASTPPEESLMVGEASHICNAEHMTLLRAAQQDYPPLSPNVAMARLCTEFRSDQI